MTDPHFFGYGSLVNTATHDYPVARAARLRGWRRVWVRSMARPVTFLSVHRVDGAVIDGLVARVPGGDWAALDEREAAYARVALGSGDLDPAHAGDVSVYEALPHLIGPSSDEHPILLSYVDTVVAGFRQVFGDEGAARFFDTTDGWAAPVLNDRDAPRYPRSTPTTMAIRDFVDDRLAALSAKVKQL